jgi:uncharacterized membrane protein YeiB
MLLGRLERADASNYRRWAAVGALVCIVIEVFSVAMMLWVEQRIWDIEGNWWIVFLRSESFPVTPLFMFSSGASALAVIGMCRLVLRRRALVWCLASVLAFGRISLTLYVSHLMFGFFLIQWIIKNSGAPDAGLMLDSAGFFCCAGILSASLWLRWFRRGPLETLFYRLAGGRPSKKSRNRARPGGNTVNYKSI